MRATSRLHDFDLVLAGDFRAAGEVAETLASHLEILSGCALDLGLLWLRDPAMPSTAPVQARLAALVRRHAAIPLEPDADAVSCAVLLLYEPKLLVAALPGLPRVRADRVIVVLAEPLLHRSGPRYEVGAASAAIDSCWSRRQLWCPATPQIRAQYREHAGGLALDTDDLRPCELMSSWRTPRLASGRRRPVLGRIIRRDDDRLPASREAAARRLPSRPGPRDALPRRRGSLARAGQAAAGKLADPGPRRGLLQALPGTPRRLRAVPGRPRPPLPARGAAGDGGWAASHPAPRLSAHARRRTGLPRPRPGGRDHPLPARRATLLRPLPCGAGRGPGRTLLPAAAAGPAGRWRPSRAGPAPPARRTIALYPTNGVGLGHVTRLLAVAHRLAPRYEPVFFTPCHALAVIEHAGFRAEYVSEPLYDETEPADHASAMAARLVAAWRHYDPAAIVFDGNVPRDAILAAGAETEAPLIWVRRGMWRPDPTLDRHMALGRRFDAVIEPAEAAQSVDAGATTRAMDDPIAGPADHAARSRRPARARGCTARAGAGAGAARRPGPARQRQQQRHRPAPRPHHRGRQAPGHPAHRRGMADPA